MAPDAQQNDPRFRARGLQGVVAIQRAQFQFLAQLVSASNSHVQKRMIAEQNQAQQHDVKVKQRPAEMQVHLNLLLVVRVSPDDVVLCNSSQVPKRMQRQHAAAPCPFHRCARRLDLNTEGRGRGGGGGGGGGVANTLMGKQADHS